jgi:hypothetical protein
MRMLLKGSKATSELSAVLSVLEAPEDPIHSETFRVGQTEENYRISQLANIVAETVPDCRIEYTAESFKSQHSKSWFQPETFLFLHAAAKVWSAMRGAATPGAYCRKMVV